MQRVVAAADDLTSDTGSRAELLRRAIGVGAGGRMDRARGRPGRIGPGPEDVIVPPRSKGGSPVARRNIDSDHLRGGSFKKQGVVRTRGLVERVGNFHVAALDRELATEGLDAGVAEIGPLNARQAAARREIALRPPGASGAWHPLRK